VYVAAARINLYRNMAVADWFNSHHVTGLATSQVTATVRDVWITEWLQEELKPASFVRSRLSVNGAVVFPVFTYSRMCSFWRRNNILSRVFTPSSLAAAEGCGQKTAQKNLQMIESTQPVLPTVKNRSCKCRRWMTGIPSDPFLVFRVVSAK
jgi:hypothetical protein